MKIKYSVCPKCSGSSYQQIRKALDDWHGKKVSCIGNEDCSLCKGKSFVTEIVAFEYKLSNKTK